MRPVLMGNEQTQKLIIIKSWNEWAEGNVMEPDSIFGYQLLDAYKNFVSTLSMDNRNSNKK